MCRALLAIIALLGGFLSEAAAEDTEPPPLSFDTPPLTPNQQAEFIKYRFYLSSVIRSQIDFGKVRGLLKEGGEFIQAHAVKFIIRISPSGRVTSRRVAASCGYEPLDSFFLEALDRAGPLNSPPAFAIFQPQDIDVGITPCGKPQAIAPTSAAGFTNQPSGENFFRASTFRDSRNPYRSVDIESQNAR